MAEEIQSSVIADDSLAGSQTSDGWFATLYRMFQRARPGDELRQCWWISKMIPLLNELRMEYTIDKRRSDMIVL